MLPLVLHQWARKSHNLLSHHILNAFEHDQLSGLHREKHAEDVFLNVEAAFRVALGGGRATIGQLFPGARMHEKLMKRKVYVLPQDSWERKPSDSDMTPRISEVGDLVNDRKEVWELLSDGMIVVSNLHNEKAMECVSPLWDAKSGEMIIMGTQVKRRALFFTPVSRVHIPHTRTYFI